jgi:hypothetical protein
VFPSDALCAFAGLFILGMAWLRTRLHYSRGGPGRPRLRAAGAAYFTTLALLLLLGWFAAPLAGRAVAPAGPLIPTLARGVWFLAVYYLSIALHRGLRTRGLAVFG